MDQKHPGNNMRLGRVFGAVGAAIGKRPFVFFLASIVVFLASMVFVIVKPPGMVLSFDNGYTTPDAPSVRELDAQVGFFGNRGKPWYMALFGQPRRANRSMTEDKEFDELKQFYKRIKMNLTIVDTPERRHTYMDYCEPMCNFNEVLFMTHNLAWLGYQWPVTSLLTYKSNIGKHFFERKMDGEELVSSQLEALYFMVFTNSTQMEKDIEEFERLVQREVKLHNSLDENTVTITQHGARGVQEEIRRGTGFVAVKAVIGLSIALVFTLVALVLLNKSHGRCTGWVLVLILAVVMVPVMGMTTATALFSLFGRHLNTLCSLAPVVGFAFGIDGMFHLYNSWLYESNVRKDCSSEILRETFASVYPALSLVWAPALGFLFGGLFPIPELSNVLLYFGTIILTTYIYQTLFFAPVMVWCSPMPQHMALPTEKCQNECNQGCNVADCWHFQITEPMGTIFARSKMVLIGCLFFYAAVVGLPAIFGAEKIQANLDYRHLLPPGSPAAKGIHFMSDRVWPEFLHIIYIIEQPPDFEDPEQYSRFEQFVSETEQIPNAMGRDANMMWLYDFKRFTNTQPSATSLNMSYFEAFIKNDIYKAWRSGVQFELNENAPPNITRMVYMVAVEGTRTMADKARVMQNFRKISGRYPEFQAIPFDTEVGMVDVILQMPQSLLVIPLIIFLILLVLLLLFTFNVAVSIVAIMATISVYTSTLCVSSLLGVTLNPFSIAFLLIVAALASRYVVYFVYFFQQVLRLIGKGGELKVMRMQETLKKALLPTLLSVLVGGLILLPLLVAPILIFHRVAIVNLVQVVFGILHSVLFVPALLSLLPRQLTGTGCLISSN